MRQQLRVAVLAGSIVVALAASARADDCGQPCPPAPQFRTVCVNEWVPEKYETTRTVYKQECVQEKYTAFRCESVPETRTRNVTTYEKVPVVQEVVKKVCVSVPHVEERTVMEKHWVTVPETKVVRKCVDKGHYECKEVECGPSCWEKMRHHFHKKDCCEECPPCPRTKTVKVWVPCPVWEEHTICCTKKVCEYRPKVCHVTVCKTEVHEEKCQVTVWKCVPKTHTETYTVCVERKVPFEATRTVTRCVPVQEKVTCTRMVCRKVEKQVPVETCCETVLCCKPKHHRHGWMGGHHSSCGCD
jgi:hypothetical protein